MMSLNLKSIGRNVLRAYLTYTPISKGRYPLMMALHRCFIEPIDVKVRTKDRGEMILNLEDEAQYTMYYNMYEWSYLPVINSLIENSNIVLDIGANIGQYALLFAKHSRKIYAFEPSQRMVARLHEQIKLNQLDTKITVIQKALSNVSGWILLTIPSRGNTGQATTILTEGSGLETEKIEAITLDEFLDSQGITEVDLIKMDIEGGELSALKGMYKVFSLIHKPIVILEMNDSSMSAAGYSSMDIINELGAYGYRPFQFLRQGKLKSLDGTKFAPSSENYCFLTPAHLQLEKVKRVLL